MCAPIPVFVFSPPPLCPTTHPFSLVIKCVDPSIPVSARLEANQYPETHVIGVVAVYFNDQPCTWLGKSHTKIAHICMTTRCRSCISGRAHGHDIVYEKVARSPLESYEMAAGIRILWRCHACGRLPLLAWGHPDRPLGNSPSPVDRHPNLSSTDTAPFTASTGTFIRLRLTRVVPGLGPKARPCAPFGINTSGRPSRTPQH